MTKHVGYYMAIIHDTYSITYPSIVQCYYRLVMTLSVYINKPVYYVWVSKQKQKFNGYMLSWWCSQNIRTVVQSRLEKFRDCNPQRLLES